jgi:hypothetical protein
MKETDMTTDRQITAHGRVVHFKREPFDVYIGRPSKWGNPFAIGKDGTRADVIRKYEGWLRTQPALLATLPELRGKVLGCWCAPQACHGDVLVRLAEIHED